MTMETTQLLFLRLTLANTYDQQNWACVQEVCRQIDELTIRKAALDLKALRESAS